MSKFMAASEKRLTKCCRASSVWARRAQSSANNSSVMSSTMGFVRARTRRRLKRLPFVQKQMQMLSGGSSLASRRMILKKMENKVKTRTHPCLTLLEMAEDGEKFWGTANACQDFPQSITADSIKGLRQVYESCL